MAFQAELVKNQLCDWIRNWFDENGPGCPAVLGISGGKDSSIVRPCAPKPWEKTGFLVF